MPRRKTSIKCARADRKKHIRNLKVKHPLKKAIKKLQSLLTEKNIVEAKTLLTQIFSQLDKAAKKQIIHPNTANRKKSRLTKQLAKIS